MLGQPGKGQIDLVCSDHPFPEFPELVTATVEEDKRTFFDATAFLAGKKPPLNIQDFFRDYKAQMSALCKALELDPAESIKVNKQGHYLIEFVHIFLFLCFSEPGFIAHVNSRMYELFKDGISLSDSYLLTKAVDRIPQDLLMRSYGHEE